MLNCYYTLYLWDDSHVLHMGRELMEAFLTNKAKLIIDLDPLNKASQGPIFSMSD